MPHIVQSVKLYSCIIYKFNLEKYAKEKKSTTCLDFALSLESGLLCEAVK